MNVDVSRISMHDALVRIRQVEPERIHEHWVQVEELRYPPKQVLQLLTGRPRATFTSHQALRIIRSMGFETSRYERTPRKARDREETLPGVTDDRDEPGAAFTMLVQYISSHGLTHHLAAAEAALEGSDADGCARVIDEFEFSEDILDAALAVRASAGRLNDVIHAATIARALPLILQPGEIVRTRPSLGAGNDPGRPFDLETDRRIAEFKVSQWKGADTMRKRTVFADLVHLALDASGRQPQLYVVGPLPQRFLTRSKATAEWALGRSSPTMRSRFANAFGPASEITVADFTATFASRVEVVDLAQLIPSLSAGT
ncbi:PE-PGRS family protein [Streptomyces sp. SID6673]|nr:PE-PGRS family protein [Streptomyces sp. SID11726]NEB26583.1 PE-PGRS family protein [Streptomyces sp. SID6673]